MAARLRIFTSVAFDLRAEPEIAIVGDPEAADPQALLNVVRGGYRPLQVVALGAPSPEGAQMPLSQGRPLVDGHAAAYVCTNLTCQAPCSLPYCRPAAPLSPLRAP